MIEFSYIKTVKTQSQLQFFYYYLNFNIDKPDARVFKQSIDKQDAQYKKVNEFQEFEKIK